MFDDNDSLRKLENDWRRIVANDGAEHEIQAKALQEVRAENERLRAQTKRLFAANKRLWRAIKKAISNLRWSAGQMDAGSLEHIRTEEAADVLATALRGEEAADGL